MKLFFLAILLAAATSPARAADVGVSVSIGQPGFYGRLDFGDYPPPQLIYQQPRMVRTVPMNRPPVYLHVPPGHARNWSRYCGRYEACGERVYFVRNNWYEQEYVPHYQGRQEYRRDDRREDRGRGPQDERQGNDHDRGRNK